MRTGAVISERTLRHLPDARSLIGRLDRHFGPKPLKRKALIKPNIAYVRWRYVSNRDRTLRAWSHQPVYVDSAGVAGELRERGIVVGPSDHYLDQEGHNALNEASALILGLSRGDDVQSRISAGSADKRKNFCLHLVPYEQEHAPDSSLLRLALNKKLLEMVSLYLGMWPRLNALGAWLNYPTTDAPKESELWHRDPEDIQVIKVFICLTDVGNYEGPFCYISTTHPFGSGAARVPKHGDPNRITDEEMRATMPEGAWMTCKGPTKTMILADTIGYHRGGKPMSGNRMLITFTYTSGTPIIRRTINITGKPTWITHPFNAMQWRNNGHSADVRQGFGFGLMGRPAALADLDREQICTIKATYRTWHPRAIECGKSASGT